MLSYFLMWCIVLGMCTALGMRLRKKTIIIAASPFVLLLPATMAMAAVALIMLLSVKTPWILSAGERRTVSEEVGRVLSRLKRPRWQG